MNMGQNFLGCEHVAFGKLKRRSGMWVLSDELNLRRMSVEFALSHVIQPVEPKVRLSAIEPLP
jgi:hypothetical protein